MATTRIKVSGYSRTKGRDRQPVYARVARTDRLKEIIAFAKSKGSSMSAPTARVYDKVVSMTKIKSLITHDIAYLYAISPSRLAIPKSLAVTSVRLYRERKR